MTLPTGPEGSVSPDPLPNWDVIPHDAEHGKQWAKERRCVACGIQLFDTAALHCDRCYAAILPSIFDYDDD